MIDGVRIWLPESLSDSDFRRVLSNLKNFHAFRNLGGTTLYGSIAEFVHGETLTAPSLAEYRMGVERFAELFHVNPSEIKVRGLEYGPNIRLERPIDRYLDLCERLPRLEPSRWENSGVKTLQYGDSGKSQLLRRFYDKIAKEVKELRKLQKRIERARYTSQSVVGEMIQREAKLRAALQSLQASHLLRGELAFKRRLMSQVRRIPGMPRIESDYVPATMLYNDQFHKALLAYWCREYFKIPKKAIVVRDRKGELVIIKGVKDYERLNAAENVTRRGLDAEFQRIDALVEDRETRKRLRRRARELRKIEVVAGKSPLIEELDLKVEQLAKLAGIPTKLD